MASGSGSQTPLKQLEDQLTCSICLELYTNPRSLPCLHSFCEKCLKGLPVAVQGNKPTIACPTCRTVTETTGPAGFPIAIHINNLKEVYSLMKKASVTDHHQTMCDNCTDEDADGYCWDCQMFLCEECICMHMKWSRFTSHILSSLEDVAASTPSQLLCHGGEQDVIKCSTHKKSVKIFCESCQELICRDCTVRLHKDHEYDTIAESYKKFNDELEDSLIAVNEKLSDSTDFLSDLTARQTEIERQREIVKGEIHALIEQIKEDLIEEVEVATDSKLLVLMSQKKSTEMNLISLNKYKDFVEQSMAVNSQHQLLMSKKQIMKHKRYVLELDIDNDVLEENDVEFIGVHPLSLASIGEVTYTRQQCEVSEIDRCDIIVEQESLSFPLSIKLPDPSKTLLIVPLSSLSCNVISTKSPINTTVTTTDQPGVYKVHCTPTVRGHIEVNVKVNDEQLNSVSTTTPINPYCNNITRLHTVEGVIGPCGLATKHGCVCIVENVDNGLAMMNLAMMNENKKAKKILGKIKFSCPRGIAVTHDDHILVTDDHKIQKISIDGRIVVSIGNEGNEPLEFDFPCGITVSSTTGHVYVADRNNHRIQVLNPDLSYSFSFGSKGSDDGEFNHPGFTALDDEHNIYVTDMNNHRIQKFDSKGNFLAQFTKPNSSLSPAGITIGKSNHLLYVADGCNISIFTVDGHFLKSFKVYDDDHTRFEGITFDSKGNLYVSDYKNHQLLVF